MVKSEEADVVVKHTDFAELLDGSLVEMIEDPNDPTKSLFAVYKDGVVRYAPWVDEGDTRWMPWPRTDPETAHIGLAQGANSFEDIEKLESQVASVFVGCLDLELEARMVMTAFTMTTWLREKLPVAPYVAFVGPPGSGKTTAMRALNLLCYHSFLTADISSAAFYDLSHRMHPTLLLDETLTAGRPRELMHLLKSSSTPGIVSLRKGKSFLGFGPKVFSWLQLPEDSALNSRCVILPTVKTSRHDLRMPNDPNVLKFAARIRMRLLQFRFENLRTQIIASVPALPLSGRTFDLYRALAAPFDKDEKMREFLAAYIPLRQQSQTDVLSATQNSTLRILYDFIHEHSDKRGPTLSTFTAALNADLKNRGEPGRLAERKVGAILTALSFTNRPRSNKGFVVWLERSDRERLHHIARQYGIAEARERCDLCSKAKAGRGADTAANQIDNAAKADVSAPSQKRFNGGASAAHERGERREHREYREEEEERPQRNTKVSMPDVNRGAQRRAGGRRRRVLR